MVRFWTRRTLRAQLVLLVLVALLPVTIFAGVLIAWDAERHREVVERSAIAAARALIAAVDRELIGTVTTLGAIATSETFDQADLRVIYESLRRVGVTQPDSVTLQVASPDGRQLLDLQRPYGEALPGLADRRGLDRVVRLRQPHVGEVVVGRAGRQHSLDIDVPVVRGDRVKYVLTAVVSAATFDPILAGQRIPGDWVSSVLDARHVHVARTRGGDRFVGERASADLVSALEWRSEGFISVRSPDAGRLYAAFSRSQWSGWSVVLGIPASAVEAPWRRSLLGFVAVGIVAALLGGLLALLVGRRLAQPIVALAAAAPAVVRGERPPLPRATVTELATLTDALEVAAADRERALADLRRTDRLLQAVFAGTTDAVYVKDLGGRYLMMNEAGARLLGRGVEEVVGRDDAELFTPESARRIMRQDREIVETGETRTHENVSLETAGGIVRSFLSTKAPYRDVEGQVIGVMGITRDITARKVAEEERARALEREQAARAEAESANRAKDEFLAVVSHELRTPLNAVYGWARMLRRGALDPGTVGRALDVIERNATAQLQLIEDLLDISRIITGKMRLDVRPIEVSAAVAAAVDAVRPAADAKGIQLSTVLDPRAGPVMGDPDRLQQIVWNLVSNAVKFTARGGRVDVSARRVDSHVEIAVSDTGEGIAPDILPYVFDRFRQGDSTPTRAHGGLGLGLALVRHLTELHGGTVAAASPGEGKGSTFVVKLPLSVVRPAPAPDLPPSAHPSIPAALADSLRGMLVLVVDDDQDALDLVSAILREAGAEPRVCVSAATAMEMLREWQPDVLVTDLEMPGEDGYALLRRVQAFEREHGVRVPAVALTAHGRLEDRVQTLSAGFAMHLPKPIEPAELVAVLAALVRRGVRHPPKGE